MARPEDEKCPETGVGAQMQAETPSNYLRADKPAEVHPREIIQRMIAQRCELYIDQIAMLREMKSQIQFMGRDEAQLLLRAIRSADCTGLLRW